MRRFDSPEAYILYLCKCPEIRRKERMEQRTKEDFYRHCCDLFREQKGRCALMRLNMTWHRIRRGIAVPTHISIDRIDNSKGYVIGNVRLICQIVNKMRMDNCDETFLLFASLLTHRYINGMDDCNYQPPLSLEQVQEKLSQFERRCSQ